jgi:hypothetical protein
VVVLSKAQAQCSSSPFDERMLVIEARRRQFFEAQISEVAKNRSRSRRRVATETLMASSDDHQLGGGRRVKDISRLDITMLCRAAHFKPAKQIRIFTANKYSVLAGRIPSGRHPPDRSAVTGDFEDGR